MKRIFTDPQTARETLSKRRDSRYKAELSKLWETVSKEMANAGPLIPYIRFEYSCDHSFKECFRTLKIVARHKEEFEKMSEILKDDEGTSMFCVVLRNVYFGNFTWSIDDIPSDSKSFCDKQLRNIRAEREVNLKSAYNLLVEEIELFLSAPTSGSLPITMDIVESPYRCLVAKQVANQLSVEGHDVVCNAEMIGAIEGVRLPEPQEICTALTVTIKL